MSLVSIANNRKFNVTYEAMLAYLLCGIFANAYLPAVLRSVSAHGFMASVYNTFGVSVVAIIAMFVIVSELIESEVKYRVYDKFIVGAALLSMLIPFSVASWIGATIVAALLFRRSNGSPTVYSISIILFMLAFHAQWVKYLMMFFREYILFADAFLVASLLGLQQDGNLISTFDSTTVLQVLEACSSFTNLSIAFLGYAVVALYAPPASNYKKVAIIAAVCILVVGINTTRIGLIAWRPDLYDIVHGPVGASVASWLSSLVILAVPYFVLNHGKLRNISPL